MKKLSKDIKCSPVRAARQCWERFKWPPFLQMNQDWSLSRGPFSLLLLLRGAAEGCGCAGHGSPHHVFSKTLGVTFSLSPLGPLPTCFFLKRGKEGRVVGNKNRDKKKAPAHA